MVANRYELRKKPKHIDIILSGGRSGTGYEVRIPIRYCREKHAEEMAVVVLSLLNEYHRVTVRGEALRWSGIL